MDEVIVAIDPGRDKAGIAVVSRTAGTLRKLVAPADELAATACALASEHHACRIVVGDKTGSSDVVRNLRNLSSLEIVTIDEHRSSMEGRERYLREHPGRGLARLLPIGLRSPDHPYDDYVAEILAARYFRGV